MNKKKVIKTCISIMILFLIWTIVTETGLVNSYILPSPFKVLESFLKMVQSGEIFEDIYISYIRVLQGFFLATFLAFILAIASKTTAAESAPSPCFTILPFNLSNKALHNFK